MALVNVDTKEMMDEASRVIVPQLKPILDEFAQQLVDGLKQLLVGRKLTITINID